MFCRMTAAELPLIQHLDWDGEADRARLKLLFPTWKRLMGTLVEVLEWQAHRELYLVRTLQLKKEIKFSSFSVYLKPISALETLAMQANDDS